MRHYVLGILLGVGFVCTASVADKALASVGAGYGGGGSAAAADVGADVAASFYTPEQLTTLRLFANAVFSSTPGAIFPQFSAPNDIWYKHFKPFLSSSSPMRGKLLRPEILKEEFSTYFTKICTTDTRRLNESWIAMPADASIKETGGELADRKAAMISFFNEPADATRIAMQYERFVQKTIIRANGQAPQRMIVMGDIHGSLHALLSNLLMLFEHGYINDDFVLADNVHLMFLGDFTDRGMRGIETIYTILRLKNTNWDQVHIVRGNHEDHEQTELQGFMGELQIKYPDQWRSTFAACHNFYATLPAAIFFGFYDDVRRKMIFGVGAHGLMSPFFDPSALLNDPTKYYVLLQNPQDRYVNPAKPSIQKAKAHLFEWSDVTGDSKHEMLAANDLEPLLAGGSAAALALLNNSRWKFVRGLNVYYKDLTKMLAVSGILFQIRGHQDDHAAVKVCCAGEERPMSVRGHPAFQAAGINPHGLFYSGISLANVPNCITTTTCSEAKLMPTEGFVWFEFGNSIEQSRWGAADIKLVNIPCAELAAMTPTKPTSLGDNCPPIDIPGMIVRVATTYDGACQSFKGFVPAVVGASDDTTGAFLKTLLEEEHSAEWNLYQEIVKRHGAFAQYCSFTGAQTEAGELSTSAQWQAERGGLADGVTYGAIAHRFTEPAPGINLGDAQAYVPPVPMPVVVEDAEDEFVVVDGE